MHMKDTYEKYIDPLQFNLQKPKSKNNTSIQRQINDKRDVVYT